MKFNFFETSIKAFLFGIDQRLVAYQEYTKQRFPLYIMNTGDEVYLSNLFKDEKNQPYQKVPRMIFNIGGFSVNDDEISNPYNVAKFVDLDKESGYKTHKRSGMRRIPVVLSIESMVTFSNIFQYFTFLEIFLMTTYRTNIFKYYYLDKLLTGSFSYSASFDGDQNLNLAFDNEKRQITLPIPFEISLQFPSLDYFGDNTFNLGSFGTGGAGRGDNTTDLEGNPIQAGNVPDYVYNPKDDNDGNYPHVWSEGDTIGKLLHRVHPNNSEIDPESSEKIWHSDSENLTDEQERLSNSDDTQPKNNTLE